MGNIIVVLILIVAIFFALRSSTKHVKGEGGCCGGGCDSCAPKTKKKKLDGTIKEKKVIYIDGMHCDHCKQSVEGAIDAMPGAVGRVNLKENLAEVSMEQPIKDDILKEAIEALDFRVIRIETKEA
ncbi:MAG: heavy metal-associated domain-containing protein [Anaerostipes sp.]|nr:heavy metal-associated domain-containing protein [Anaerostipes sp.]